ncbi:MAG: PspA/IM30 family protein [Pirellulaceae bacterium]
MSKKRVESGGLGMFKAIGKYIRAFFYLITFRIDKASESLRMNPGVMSATYDRIIEEKRGRLAQYKDAIAAMIAQEEGKKEKLKKLTEEIQKLEKLKAGAAAKARKVSNKHGGDPEATRNDPEYQKCQAAFKDFSSTLAEKEARVDEIEADMEALAKNIEGHKINIQSQLRDLEKLGEEKHDAVATVLSAKEEKDIADIMTGLSQDRTSEELRELRQLRQKASAGARVSRELAGLDARQAEEEFLQFATESEADDEFDALIGLTTKDDGETGEQTRIPEA